jgi:hypothetical protein
MEKEEIKIIKADYKYRKSLFIAYGAVVIGGILFFAFIAPFLIAELKRLLPHASFIISEIIVITFLLAFFGPALYLISIGKKIKQHAQFPYPGMKVIHDTKVLSGKKALLRANLLIYLGCFACALAIVSSISVHCIFHKLDSEMHKIFLYYQQTIL